MDLPTFLQGVFSKDIKTYFLFVRYLVKMTMFVYLLWLISNFMTNTCENPGKMVHILFTATILWKYVIGIDTPVIFQWCEIIVVFMQQCISPANAWRQDCAHPITENIHFIVNNLTGGKRYESHSIGLGSNLVEMEYCAFHHLNEIVALWYRININFSKNRGFKTKLLSPSGSFYEAK